jgi:signal transduction histidine kinase
VSDGPTVEELRQTQAAWTRQRRRLRYAWPPMLAFVGYVVSRKPPYLGLHGASLGLSFALAAFLIGLVACRHALLFKPSSRRVSVSLLVLLLAGSTALVWLQPAGPGVLGFLMAGVMVLMTRLIPSRLGLALLSAGCLIILVSAALTGKEQDHSRWLGVAVSVLPLLGFFFLTSLFMMNRRVQETTEELLDKLEETRVAELRSAALAERQRLARDMHDVLAHTLSGLTLQLEGARLMAQLGGDERVARAVERAHELAKNGLAEARQAISMLRGDELPGPDRLEGLADAFAADTGIPCRFTVCGTVLELRPEVKLALYRVTQEALTNIRKHGHPDRVSVTLEYRAGDVDLAIQDFGAGPVSGPVPSDGPEQSGGYGLAGMRERAELLGGTLTAGPTDDGFRVELRVAA